MAPRSKSGCWKQAGQNPEREWPKPTSNSHPLWECIERRALVRKEPERLEVELEPWRRSNSAQWSRHRVQCNMIDRLQAHRIPVGVLVAHFLVLEGLGMAYVDESTSTQAKLLE